MHIQNKIVVFSQVSGTPYMLSQLVPSIPCGWKIDRTEGQIGARSDYPDVAHQILSERSSTCPKHETELKKIIVLERGFFRME